MVKNIKEKIICQGTYKPASWIFLAEVYPKPPDESNDYIFGYYIACKMKEPE